MNNAKIRVVRGPTMQDKSITTVVGSITVGILVAKGDIPHFDAKESPDGYQRTPVPSRIKEIVLGIQEKRVDLPTAILLNVREKPDDVLSGKDDNMIFDVSRVKKLFIVDGQHRYLALQKLMENGDIPSTYKIPFVSMVGSDREAEMRQFHTVNSKAKPVPTGLALKLLTEIAHNEERRGKPEIGVRVEQARKGTVWKIIAQELTDKMYSSSSVWKGRIRMPNDPKGDTVIASASMVLSLKDIAQNPYFSGIRQEQQQLQIMDAYWKGIQNILPEAFNIAGDVRYSIQKATSVRVLHGVLPDVLERVKARNQSLFSPKSYESVMREPLEELSATNVHGEDVFGLDFWKEGKEGAVGTFSGSVNINILIDKIKTSLPPIEIPDFE